MTDRNHYRYALLVGLWTGALFAGLLWVATA
jgi:hypothetical protein